VIINVLTKSAHFIVVNQKDDDGENLVEIYVNEIARKRAMPKKIV
jgi:hypothetical protein